MMQGDNSTTRPSKGSRLPLAVKILIGAPIGALVGHRMGELGLDLAAREGTWWAGLAGLGIVVGGLAVAVVAAVVSLAVIGWLTPSRWLHQVSAPDEPNHRHSEADEPGETVEEKMIRQASDADPRARAEAASSWHLPPTLLVALASDPDTDVREAAVRTWRLPVETLVTLVSDDQSAVRAAVAASESLPDEQLGVLASDPDSRVREAVASQSWHLTGETLAALASDSHLGVRAAVAKYVRSAALLERLAYDPDERVARVAFANTALPTPALCTALASDRWDRQVSRILDEHDDARDAIRWVLENMVEVEYAPLRCKVVGCKSATVLHIEMGLADPDIGVRTYAAGNPHAAPAQILKALESEHAAVRAAAAANPVAAEALGLPAAPAGRRSYQPGYVR